MLRINHEIAWVCFGIDCWPWDTFTSIVPWQFNWLLVALIINLVIIIIKSALRQLLAIAPWRKVILKFVNYVWVHLSTCVSLVMRHTMHSIMLSMHHLITCSKREWEVHDGQASEKVLSLVMLMSSSTSMILLWNLTFSAT